MTKNFNPNLDTHIEVAEDILECLQSKSKWGSYSWTWVSLSNLEVYYDNKVVQTYNGHFIPDKVNLGFFLEHLADIGLVEKNPELFLRDKFFRLTPRGRELLKQGGDSTYQYLSEAH